MTNIFPYSFTSQAYSNYILPYSLPTLAPAALLIAEKYQAKYVVIFGAIVGMIGIAISSALVSMGFVVFFFGVWYGE